MHIYLFLTISSLNILIHYLRPFLSKVYEKNVHPQTKENGVLVHYCGAWLIELFTISSLISFICGSCKLKKLKVKKNTTWIDHNQTFSLFTVHWSMQLLENNCIIRPVERAHHVRSISFNLRVTLQQKNHYISCNNMVTPFFPCIDLITMKNYT